jgi:hypothetical protein
VRIGIVPSWVQMLAQVAGREIQCDAQESELHPFGLVRDGQNAEPDSARGGR